MGIVRFTRADGSGGEVRTNSRTKHLRLGHEKPTSVDLSELGATPALAEISLSGDEPLAAVDLSPLAGCVALTSLRLSVARAPDLRPLAKLPLSDLSLDVGGSRCADLQPLAGHRSLAALDLGFLGTQKSLDLSFVRDFPHLDSLSIDGGNWKKLDLSPLRGLALKSFSLVRQYVSAVDLDVLAQPALEHLILEELEIRTAHLSLVALRVCKRLRHLSLLGAEVRMLDVGGLTKLTQLRQFDPPNGAMTMSPSDAPITAPGLKRWASSIGIE